MTEAEQQAEVCRLLTALAEARQALRQLAIEPANVKTYGWGQCYVCSQQWMAGDPENHRGGCLAAVREHDDD